MDIDHSLQDRDDVDVDIIGPAIRARAIRASGTSIPANVERSVQRRQLLLVAVVASDYTRRSRKGVAMRRILFTLLPLLICSCDDYRGPNLSLPTNGETGSQRDTRRSAGRQKEPMVYSGKTADQWAKLLQSNDREQIGDACRALRVLGREGRQYLFQGLDSQNSEARRMCLECMTIADFKKMSESGRQKLVVLSGDYDDMRIRERASMLLQQWRGSIPAP
jgi:hypothetical protein